MNLTLDARTATSHFLGISRYVKNLARALPPELQPGEDLLVLHDSGQAISWIDDLVRRHECRSKPVPISPFSLAQQWQIPRLLRKAGAHIYHSPYYLMPYRPGIPTVLTVYDLIPLRFPQFVSARARLLFRLAMTLALRASDQVIAISEATRQDLHRAFHLPKERIHAIPLAAGENFRPPAREEMERARAQYNLPDEYVLYLGINKPHKNLPRLVEAWAQLTHRRAIDNQKLVIAGAWDPRYPQAEQLAANLNVDETIVFLGSIPEADLPALYGAARLFVFPSLYEGFGLPVLEALSCGTPVACSHTASLPEVAGEAAIYFDPAGPDKIAEALAKALNNAPLLEGLKARGLEQARKFTWRRTARQTLQVYRQARTSN
ncbi:MAG: glycosyltransferase family 1 protein [Anaerolineales bacterium]